MATIDERIAALTEKLKQEKAKKQKIEARQKQLEKKKSRADETRKKILIGAVILKAIEKGQLQESQLNALCNSYLTRDDDRALFGLSPKVEQASNQQQGA